MKYFAAIIGKLEQIKPLIFMEKIIDITMAFVIFGALYH